MLVKDIAADLEAESSPSLPVAALVQGCVEHIVGGRLVDLSLAAQRRCRRADEVGVPLTVTVDYQTRDNGTVTLRDRDTWNQVRNEWKAIPDLTRQFFEGKLSFSQLGTPVSVSYE